MAEDESGRIVVANGAFTRMCGLPPDAEVIGQNAQELRERVWRELLVDVDDSRRLTAEVRARREPRLGVEVLLADGRTFDRDYVPVAGPDGSLVHMWHYR